MTLPAANRPSSGPARAAWPQCPAAAGTATIDDAEGAAEDDRDARAGRRASGFRAVRASGRAGRRLREAAGREREQRAGHAEDGADERAGPAGDQEEERGEHRAGDLPDVGDQRGHRVAAPEELGLDGVGPDRAGRCEERRAARARERRERDQQPGGAAALRGDVEGDERSRVSRGEPGEPAPRSPAIDEPAASGSGDAAKRANAATAKPPSR